MNASIISVGQELLLGDTINTNASWLGTFLSENAINLRKVITIGDDAKMIIRSLDQTLKRSDLVIVTGGLGPTHDDITKQAIAEYFDVGFVRHEPSYEQIQIAFKKRGIPFSASNHTQADVLTNAQVLLNTVGTAPGMWIETKGRILVILPGVPYEMKYLMKNEVMPRLKVKNGNSLGYYSRYFQLCGIGESNLSDNVIGDLSGFLNERLTLAYLPHRHYITLRLSSYASTVDQARLQAASLEDHIRKTAGSYIFSESPDEKLESSVVKLLVREQSIVATAESCSGGQLAHLITNVSGSSSVFNGGVVVYSNEMKSELLGLSETLINKNGAVSKEVALEMAQSVAKKFGADFGLSTTGIAGPTGGTPDKPVGTVWIGFWSENSHFAVKAQLFTEREANKERSAVIALDILRRHLQKITELPYDLKTESAEK
jgi:nicotinamide-nucleotide amidase